MANPCKHLSTLVTCVLVVQGVRKILHDPLVSIGFYSFYSFPVEMRIFMYSTSVHLDACTEASFSSNFHDTYDP